VIARESTECNGLVAADTPMSPIPTSLLRDQQKHFFFKNPEPSQVSQRKREVASLTESAKSEDTVTMAMSKPREPRSGVKKYSIGKCRRNDSSALEMASALGLNEWSG
jgi:hypothetical protein